ncbi:Post-GPI attachment to proteins factor [Paragonimus heterotremus]|uniref:Post-GPI attachment to proteins factor 3 n=1 Tax=Paragonimus heterotremus TaxID=100268 RepID=A0A8J4SWE4_9TREM|nr:Post-GPI attachment to proteins factor [Paragonimus heterotremus]
MCAPLILVLFACWIDSSCASAGDRSYVFYSCRTQCVHRMCELQNRGVASWDQIHPLTLCLLEDTVRWQCDRECVYRCMWKTVEAFQRDNLSVPQFYGKWPFVRMLGIQEPASTLFSLINLLTQAFGLYKLCVAFSISLPMWKYWVLQSLFSMNAWLWSTVFHTVDTPLTEKLDYFAAVAFILASIVTLQGRILPNWLWLRLICVVALLIFFVRHVDYMSTHRFDYGYNMLVAVISGLINCSGWLLWSFGWCTIRQHPHVIYCRFSVLCLLGCVALELCDFAPLAWFLDAHALWHASSWPLILLWYKFVLDDCSFQLGRNKKD